jgi:hypothetical protein
VADGCGFAVVRCGAVDYILALTGGDEMGELKHPTEAWIVMIVIFTFLVFGIPTIAHYLGVFK